MDAPDSNELFRSAQKLLKGGQWDAGEAALRQLAALNPANDGVLHFLGKFLLGRKRFAEASDVLARARAINFSTAIAADLVLAYQHGGNIDAAIAVVDEIILRSPGKLTVLQKKAELLKHKFDGDGALEVTRLVYERTLTEDSAVFNYADALMGTGDHAAVLAVLRTFLAQKPASPDIAVRAWERIVKARAASERQTSGLDTLWASTWDDAHAAKTLPEFEAWRSAVEDVRDPSYDTLVSCITFETEADRTDKVAVLLRQASRVKPGTICDVTNLGEDVPGKAGPLSDDAFLASLAPIVHLCERPLTGNIIFIGCDDRYFFSFARPLLRSLECYSPGAHVHIHIMASSLDGASSVLRDIATYPDLEIALTAEQPTIPNGRDAHLYYHSIRYVRFYQLLRIYNQPMWMMDADLLVNRDPIPHFAAANDHDIALCVNAATSPPWNKIIAWLVGVMPTEKGFAFARLVASQIAHWYSKNQLRWYMDQAALFCAYDHLRTNEDLPATHFLQYPVLDRDWHDESVIWLSSGRWKYVLEQVAAGNLASGNAVLETPFAKAFLSYTKASAKKERP